MQTGVDHRLARLRENLLGGRGPGASGVEVASHTRDRALIGRVPASRELALVEEPAHLARGDRSIADGVAQRTRAGRGAGRPGNDQ